MTEHDLQNSIRLSLSRLGYIVFRVNVGKVKTDDGRYFDTGLPKGHSDLVAYKDGKTCFIEVKSKGRKPTPYQLNFIEQMKKNGFRAGVVYSVQEAIDICEG